MQFIIVLHWKILSSFIDRRISFDEIGGSCTKKRKNRYICNNFREIIKEIIINID